MASRTEIIHELSTLNADEILRLLSHDALLQVKTKYYELHTRSATENGIAYPSPPMSEVIHLTSPDRAKRPLNAFMAYRSYYLKIFPDVQQKTASGFLTTLWGKDPVRNKWALIAKVYSFIRDEVGKSKVTLAGFLNVCCPKMRIIEPERYLVALGWSIGTNDQGSQVMIQNASQIQTMESDLDANNYPDTEMSLLSSILDLGYLQNESSTLLQKMSANSNGMMATNAAALPHLSGNASKNDFMGLVIANNTLAGQNIANSESDDRPFAALEVRNCFTSNGERVPNHPMDTDFADEGQFHDTDGMVLEYFLPAAGEEPRMPEYNVDNTFSLDMIPPIYPQPISQSEAQHHHQSAYGPLFYQNMM